jgi:hypothetical protein
MIYYQNAGHKKGAFMTLPTALDPNAYLPNHTRAELDFSGNVTTGGNKKQAKFVQERLCMAGFAVHTDGDFGPATKQALQNFQRDNALTQSGVYGMREHDLLTRPFVDAINPFPAGAKPLGDLIVRAGRQHVKQHPIEIGGENSGPWVRMYMDGNEGIEWKWCAGFSFFMIAQACAFAGKPMPMAKSFTVDTVVDRAKAANLFLSEAQAKATAGKARIVPGSLFVVRASSTHWSHVGIVSQADKESFGTIEGNTNNDGSSNGFEAIEQVRGYKGKDFVVW